MTVLNTADRVYLGTSPADAVYAGAAKVWPPGLPPFLPSDLAGLGLWLEAGRITGLADGSPVNVWPDGSPAHRDAVSIDTPPVYRASVAQLAGKPGVQFTGDSSGSSASRLLVPGWGAALTGLSEYTLFEVVFDSGIYAWPIITTAPATGGWTWITEYDPTGIYWGSGGGCYRLYQFSPFGQAHLLTYHGTAAGPRFYLDQAEVTGYTIGPSGDIQPVPDIGPDVVVGGYWDPTTGMNGYIAAVVWYDRALTDSERQQVEVYLMGDWHVDIAQEMPAPPVSDKPPWL